MQRNPFGHEQGFYDESSATSSLTGWLTLYVLPQVLVKINDRGHAYCTRKCKTVYRRLRELVHAAKRSPEGDSRNIIQREICTSGYSDRIESPHNLPPPSCPVIMHLFVFT